jgi:predicted transcriptional regulator
MARAHAKTSDEVTPRVTVGFSATDRQRLQRLADQHERSVSWVVRRAVRTFLNEREKGQLDLDLTLPESD